MSRYCFVLVLALCSVGCSESTEPKTNSNTNWLLPCERDEECGSEGSCQCGMCTVSCTPETGCGTLENAVCVSADSKVIEVACDSMDTTLEAPAICLPQCQSDDVCGIDQLCLDGTCARVGAICAATRGWTDAQANLEQQLFDAANAMRTNGFDCGNGLVTAPPLEPKDLLTCVARAHSRDMAQRNFFSSVNPDGADPGERVRLSGISFLHADEVLSQQATPSEVLAEWQSNTVSCEALMATDVELGAAGTFQGLWTLTLVEPL